MSVTTNDLDALGVDCSKVERLLDRAKREVDDGLLPSVQLTLAIKGQVAVSASFGGATEDSLLQIFSATKAITSAAAWSLFATGRLFENERVVDIIPEFYSNGKEAVTVGQLFSHTAGFPYAPFHPYQWGDSGERHQRYQQWQLAWEPGTRFEYHPTSSMWVIADLIERRSGMSFTEFIKQKIIVPLGLSDLFVGLPREKNTQVLACEYVGESMAPEEYRQLGVQMPIQNEVSEKAILNFNKPEFRAVGVPGAGGIATAADLALFYQGLLHGSLGNNAQVWSEKTLLDARRVRTGNLKDRIQNSLANRALGVIISGDKARGHRGFGKTNSSLAFGHNGVGGQIAWADPATGLSFAYLTSGLDRHSVRLARRGVALSSLAAECVTNFQVLKSERLSDAIP